MPNVFDRLNAHVKVSHETFKRLTIYHDLLLKWQPKINLVGPDTLSQSWDRHFLDSLQIAPLIISSSDIIIDMGTGAGFPGLVLAILNKGNVHLIETDSKKIIFLKEVARLTDTPVTIHHDRIENIKDLRGNWVVSRACAPLEKLLSLSENFVSCETKCLFHKGKNYSTELEDAKKTWDFDHEAIPSLVDNQGIILKLSNIRRRG